jgi:hypothetical protein
VLSVLAVGFGPLLMTNILHMAGRFGIAHNCIAKRYLVVNKMECWESGAGRC